MSKRSASLNERQSPPPKRVQIRDEVEIRVISESPDISDKSNGKHAENGDVSDGSDQEDYEEEDYQAAKEPAAAVAADLYLETVDRKRLDFDFEKLCSVSLSNVNVYACLVCGKYFQGRGKSSHAYFHSVDEDHHVFINLQTLKVYVLPESYEVKSSALDDIKYVVNPNFTKKDVALLDKKPIESFDLNHKSYRPGFVGMNNIKQNDYLNVIVQSLAHVAPLRNFLILENFEGKSELVQRLSILVRKLWNNRAFKGHVSPHELLQHVSAISKKRFRITEQADPFDFLNWFLNNLHLALGGSKTRLKSSFVQKIFQGIIRVESQRITTHDDASDRLRFEADTKIQQSEVPFMFLSLDLPPAPLFQGDIDKNIIPQVPLQTILSKYDGSTTQELAGDRRRYKITELPPYLIFHIKRVTRTNLIEEINHTVVTFQSIALDMSPYVDGATEPMLYDLVANVTHESVFTPQGEEKHVYRVQLKDKTRDEWLQIQDLYIENIRREILFLNESCIQIWERRR
ncbi:hypothetical protein V1520DRAFT_331397 [Lipomyces starkeyi]|uniref:USP domain-containing protein n=1 Tax=Lipomyces starkeyi NRRL Y-11557 TaxID=675824 RepID=A0A1E3Q7J3_LIPST|nr:hypothetical protein LIPSTDRAFT_70649 [Lipomyces starkeyi NRRL Y-11557]